MNVPDNCVSSRAGEGGELWMGAPTMAGAARLNQLFIPNENWFSGMDGATYTRLGRNSDLCLPSWKHMDVEGCRGVRRDEEG